MRVRRGGLGDIINLQRPTVTWMTVPFGVPSKMSFGMTTVVSPSITSVMVPSGAPGSQGTTCVVVVVVGTAVVGTAVVGAEDVRVGADVGAAVRQSRGPVKRSGLL